jgi:hypothetical protein
MRQLVLPLIGVSVGWLVLNCSLRAASAVQAVFARTPAVVVPGGDAGAESANLTTKEEKAAVRRVG